MKKIIYILLILIVACKPSQPIVATIKPSLSTSSDVTMKDVKAIFKIYTEQINEDIERLNKEVDSLKSLHSTQSPESLYPVQQDLTTINWDDYKSPGVLPEYLTPYVNEISGFKTYRISDQSTFNIGDTYAKRHAYATRTPFNSDGSLILTTSNNGKVLDGNTFELLGQIDYQIIWSNIKPDTGYGVYGNTFEINKISMVDYQFTTTFKRTFSDYTEMSTDSNGNLSNDDKYIVLYGEKPTNSDCWVIVYDVETNTIVSETNMGFSISKVDWIGISQLGEYVFVLFKADGHGTAQGSRSYDKNMNFVANLTRSTSHGELGIDQEGNEVFVSFGDDITTHDLVMARLSDGKLTGLFPKVNGKLHGGHISCRNIKRPGYAYVSMYGNPTDKGKAAPLENFSIKLDESNIIERWSKNSSELAWDGSHYNQQAHGVPNQEGTKFLFSSTWGVSLEENKTYGLMFITMK